MSQLQHSNARTPSRAITLGRLKKSPLIAFYEITQACDLVCRHCRASAQPRPDPHELSPEDARRLVAEFVAHYNEVRLHSAIGYVAPADKLAGRAPTIFAERDRKLEAARERRRAAREASRCPTATAVL